MTPPTAVSSSSSESWHLLVHRLPAKPLYLRARVLAALRRAGAVALKKAVYAMPASIDRLDRLQEIAVEIRAAGGDAFVCECRFPESRDRDAVVATYRQQRAADYERVRKDARDERAASRLPAMRARLAELRALDPFASPGGDEAERVLASLELRAAPRRGRAAAGDAWIGRTWVTRRGLHVDRLACAWFVRRFLDPAARFRFVAGESPRPDELGFDLPGGAFTHEGDHCSLESLVAKTGRGDAAVRRIAEIVHDIDLKDGRFGHPETAGVERLLAGMLAATPDDDDRLERGLAFFDDLHRSLGAPPPHVSLSRRRSG